MGVALVVVLNFMYLIFSSFTFSVLVGQLSVAGLWLYCSSSLSFDIAASLINFAYERNSTCNQYNYRYVR